MKSIRSVVSAGAARAFAFLAVMAIAVAQDSESESGAPAFTRAVPNILLLMADDLGWGDVGFNGNRVIKTPNLDAMAASGLRFPQFYAAAPVCSPTRASCLTGRHPYRYGIFSANVGHLPTREITLAELLKEKGYATGHFGKWHLGTLNPTDPSRNRGRGAAVKEHFSPPSSHGFDAAFSTEAKVPTWDPMVWPGTMKPWWNPISKPGKSFPFGEPYRDAAGTVVKSNIEGDDSRIIMDRVIPFIRDAAGKSVPFFGVIWFHTPHLPVVGGPQYTAPYAKQRDYARHYYASITAMDEQIGRLRTALTDLRIAGNTILWFCSDNGPEGSARNAPGTAFLFRGRKRSLYEGGIRVPAVLEWPGQITGGMALPFPACTTDFLPTIIDILGIPLPNDRPYDGISLLPLMKGEMPRRPRPIPFESAGQLALLDHPYKIVHQPRGRSGDRHMAQEPFRFELYNVASDPGEKDNIAAAHPDIVERMAGVLRTWRASCQASRAEAAPDPESESPADD